MSPLLKIVRHPYEEPHLLNLSMVVSNGRQVATIEFYINRDTLTEWAGVLEGFPRHRDDVSVWETGSERPEDRWAYYLKLRVFTTDSAGHCAIHVRLNNNAKLPDLEISEFCIRAEAASLNRLGRLFHEFSRLEHEVLIWTPTEGNLIKTEAEAELAGCAESGPSTSVL